MFVLGCSLILALLTLRGTVDGKWSSWSPWSSCDVTCGNGTLVRQRSCNNPALRNGGLDCPGKGTEQKTCILKLCPVNGGWSAWGDWGKCSAACGVGMRSRIRSCTNPRPERFGDHCFGDSTEYELCNSGSCGDSDCYDIRNNFGKKSSGVYNVTLWKTKKIIPVYCDFDTDNGGWTVFQYRFNGSVDFNRKFSEYKTGFGSFIGEFWLGLEYIYEMVSQGKSELRLDMTSTDGKVLFETFQNFQLEQGPSYTLHIDEGVGTAGDGNDFGLSSHNGQKFSTYDFDQDISIRNCAAVYDGGWWYRKCYSVNLNGAYSKYVRYRALKDSGHLMVTRMMFRRV